MKKIMNFVAALAVVLPVSCNKEMNPSETSAPETKTIKVIMNATVGDPASKVLLDGNVFNWEEGDEVSLWFSGATSKGSVTATSSGTSVRFEGELAGLNSTSKKNLYAFYAKDGDHFSAAQCRKDISSVQTGLLEDLNEHVFWGVWVTTGNQTPTYDNDGNISSVEFNANMLPKFSVLKFFVPEELGLTEIQLESESNITGSMQIYLARNPNHANGKIGSGCHVYRPEGDGMSQSKVVTISRNGAVIAGDVYVVVAPDAYESNAEVTATSFDKYCCSTRTLKFTFTNASGSADYVQTLLSPIYMGELKNLGVLPSDIMTPQVKSPGTLYMKNFEGSYTIAVNSPSDLCEYYYEIGTTSKTCPTPTINSLKFDPEVGFIPNFTGTHDTYFIKVLAHSIDSNYKDVVLKGELKNWIFNVDSPVAEVIKGTSEGNLLTAIGESVTTEDGLNVYRRAINGSPSFTVGNKSINFTNDLLLNMQVNYNSNVYVFMCTSNYYCLSSGTTRTFYICYNNGGRTNDFNGAGNTKYQITRDSSMEEADAASESFVWNLGALNRKDKVAFLGDGNTMYYSIALFEVL